MLVADKVRILGCLAPPILLMLFCDRPFGVVEPPRLPKLLPCCSLLPLPRLDLSPSFTDISDGVLDRWYLSTFSEPDIDLESDLDRDLDFDLDLDLDLGLDSCGL